MTDKNKLRAELRAEVDAAIREAVTEFESPRFKAYLDLCNDLGSEWWKIGLNPVFFIHGDRG